MLGPQHVGSRVVVRRIVGHRGDRPVYSDILGRLVEAAETHLTVHARDGDVRVPTAEIHRAKPVPDRRRLTPTESLEVAAAAGWPAGERERLGDWLLRATGGWTMRGNSALVVGDPDLPLPAAVDAVTRWYQDRGLPPSMSVPLPLFHRVDAELDRRGWTPMPLTLVMTARLADLTAAADERVTLDTAPSPAWLASVAGRKGALPAAAVRVLTGVPQVRFASLRQATPHGAEGPLLATGRGCVADPEGRWLGLSLIGTEEHVRRQGLARRVIAALVAWGAEVGASDVYLQVEERNTGAVALYERLGLTTHHVYVTRRLLPPG
ncbi:GNAT family N-acetyltransferase [Dactylosporangium aurantiacum]|uniref:GNAT family N-acetyltransferase n=1 Tax=Dactylosporangium aurantiacum TaxID=35754 RepID=A0A9Q9IHA5_9ACTN|nr:GNAT family N-acetyltransferase [Dactylosporangium aurantiacum]MDG6104893.1 GNAT family N-acetyltransferase [Dactylosporangium aurantiacum]UWZ55566.1 GNAT family N-acetyltransferase [Dactylosporangium aurantiacum]